MDKKTLRARRRKFAAFLMALVMALEILPAIGYAEDPVEVRSDTPEGWSWYGDNGGDKYATYVYVVEGTAGSPDHYYQVIVDVTKTNDKIPATCTHPAQIKYTASVTVNGQSINGEHYYNDDNTLAPHVWGEPTYVWAEDHSKVTATRICTRDASHKETEEAELAGKVVVDSTCTAKGSITYTSKAFANNAFTAQTKTVETDIDKDAHDWGEPTYVWAEDHSKVTATRVCTRDASHQETEDAELAGKVVVDSTCTAKGSITYTSKAFADTAFTAQTEKVETAINNDAHDWGEPTYVWAEDHSKVTATRVCTRDASHKETEDAELAGKVVVDSTCTAKGSITYTSKAFVNTAFTAQTEKVETDIDKDAHDWGEPTYVWAEDHSKVTATRVCTRDASHKETEDAELAGKAVVDSTCTAKGSITYTSKAFANTAFTAQTKTVETAINNDAHDWGEPTYVWAEDHSKVTATRVCTRDASHKETEDAELAGKVVVDSTCTAKGSITYTSKAFANTAFTAQTEKVETDIDKDAHDWGEPTYVWAEDHSKVTATRVCKGDPEHKETEEAALDTTAIVDPTCTAEGSITYTSKAFINAAFTVQTDIVKTEINPNAHQWGEWETKQEATTEQEGLKERVCGVCQEKQSETIPKVTPSGDEDGDVTGDEDGDEDGDDTGDEDGDEDGDDTGDDDGDGTDGEGTGDGTSGDGTSGEGAGSDGTSGEGTSGDGTGSEGTGSDGTSGEGAGDGTSGEGAGSDGTSGDGTSGDGTSSDGTSEGTGNNGTGDDNSDPDAPRTTTEDGVTIVHNGGISYIAKVLKGNKNITVNASKVDYIASKVLTKKYASIRLTISNTTRIRPRIVTGKAKLTKKITITGKNLKAAQFDKKAFKGYKGKIVIKAKKMTKKEYKKLVKKLRKGGFKGKIYRK